MTGRVAVGDRVVAYGVAHVVREVRPSVVVTACGAWVPAGRRVAGGAVRPCRWCEVRR